jgi:putative copper export protein/methionine-rich copper-binding protein CopC
LRRFGRRSAIAALLLSILSGVFPPDAEAHKRLLGTDPAPESTVRTVPTEMRLTFSEPVDLRYARVELVGADGVSVSLGELRVAPDSANVLIAPIEGRLGAGEHTVRWVATSRDGHPVRGEFGFTIADDAAGLHPVAPLGGERAAAVPAPGQDPPPAAHHPVPGALGGEFAVDSPGYVLVRWVSYLALLGVIGAACFALLVLGILQRQRRPDDHELIETARRRAASVGLGFVGLLLLVAVARLYAQSLAMHGAEHVLDADRVATMVTRTVWGWGWMIQAAAVVVAAAGFAAAWRGAVAGWVLAALAAAALALTPALSGHAAAVPDALGAVAIVAHSAHVLGVGGWLGSLLVLLVAGIPAAMALGPARRGAAVASLVRAFSPTALLFASLVVLTGIAATAIHVGSVAALVGSRYGALLLIKVGIFGLVIGTGAYNYLRVQPVLGDDVGAERLERSVAFELGVGAAVLLLTALLVATPPPSDEARDLAVTPAAPAVVRSIDTR